MTIDCEAVSHGALCCGGVTLYMLHMAAGPHLHHNRKIYSLTVHIAGTVLPYKHTKTNRGHIVRDLPVSIKQIMYCRGLSTIVCKVRNSIMARFIYVKIIE